MIPTLATLEQAQEHLRDMEDANANDILFKLRAATQIVLNYINADDDLWKDSSEEYPQDSAGELLTVPWDIQAATLIMLGVLYKNRDGETDEPSNLGELPRTVTALLYHYRTPTII